MVAGVSRSDFSEAAAGNIILLGIITSGAGTFENQEDSIIRKKVTLFNTMQQYEIIIQKDPPYLDQRLSVLNQDLDSVIDNGF